jgi:transposase-like protein
MSANGKRRTWAASDKLRIVLAGMEPDVEVSDLCRLEGLNPVQFYDGRSNFWARRPGSEHHEDTLM